MENGTLLWLFLAAYMVIGLVLVGGILIALEMTSVFDQRIKWWEVLLAWLFWPVVLLMGFFRD